MLQLIVSTAPQLRLPAWWKNRQTASGFFFFRFLPGIFLCNANIHYCLDGPVSRLISVGELRRFRAFETCPVPVCVCFLPTNSGVSKPVSRSYYAGSDPTLKPGDPVPLSTPECSALALLFNSRWMRGRWSGRHVFHQLSLSAGRR